MNKKQITHNVPVNELCQILAAILRRVMQQQTQTTAVGEPQS